MEIEQRVFVIIVASGKGLRFGQRKQYVNLRGKQILEHSVETFNFHPLVNEIILVLDDPSKGQHLKEKYHKVKEIVKGGERRTDSVYEGFKRINCNERDLILIHDGVRPLVSPDLIERVIEKARQKGSVIPVIAIEDTVKRCEGDRVIKTLERNKIFRIQTPQAFTYGILKKAFDKAYSEGYTGSDEAYLVEKLGLEVYTVEGDLKNIKITTPFDLKLAEFYLEN
ncbi:2-C-methyl-D-erythritol 4-phosphate cytidylyltransferase [SCandidatus Aminicenantes bacterium Aminicenantia_JdfR_composite]|nr:2-C-methyl-D-erythritol 4-phosphate cytidylyltransferase [SCandidatus Aminicenantes bacterium Aminicenantia_JdfR_composite]MCP2596686.1 2-C-methyl-D-erythritol 4-phosphate cytidylyltransferase [Candidatus Aminicenantes bacterium AC-335-G13]